MTQQHPSAQEILDRNIAALNAGAAIYVAGEAQRELGARTQFETVEDVFLIVAPGGRGGPELIPTGRNGRRRVPMRNRDRWLARGAGAAPRRAAVGKPWDGGWSGPGPLAAEARKRWRSPSR